MFDIHSFQQLNVGASDIISRIETLLTCKLFFWMISEPGSVEAVSAAVLHGTYGPQENRHLYDAVQET